MLVKYCADAINSCNATHSIVFYHVLFTQTGQRHGSQMNRVHGVRSLVQCPDKLEVEDPTNQATDTAC